jgi:Domain of unknown function (DUF5667)
VKFDFLDRRSAERFAELLDETSAGRRHHTRGRADEQLAELVAIGHRLSAPRPGVQVEPEFRMGLRAMLVATAERDGIGEGATSPDDESEAAAPVRKLLGQGGRRIRARGAIVIGVAAGAMAVSGISAASENASPGDALYGVKRSTERAQLAMAGSDITRGQLSLTFARNRLSEAVSMDGDNVKFPAALADMDADATQGVKLLTTSAVTREDPTGLNYVDSFVDTQRRVLTPALERLNNANRERALASLDLLDRVQGRSEHIRDGLACDAELAPSDALGPSLSSCKAGSETSSSSGERRQGQTQTQSTGGEKNKSSSAKGDSGTTDDKKKSKSDPKATDDPTAEPTATTGGKASVAEEGEEAEQSAEPSKSVSAGPEPMVSEDLFTPPAEDKGLLGGLLGNLFGKD